MLFPVYLNEKDVELPNEGTYYVLAKNGIFLHRDTGIVQGLAKVDKIAGLEELEPKVRLNLPKIPTAIVFQALTFFRRVWYKYQAESEVCVYYHKDKHEYLLHAPKQEVSGAGVEYAPKKNNEEDQEEVAYHMALSKEGWRKVGTIHSHCNFGAYHSSIDTGDEAKFDGVHITIGNVDQENNFSMASSLVINNNRFQVDPESTMLGLAPKSAYNAKSSSWMSYSPPASYYEIPLSKEQKEQWLEMFGKQIDEEWMPRVKQRKYAYSGQTNYYNKRGKKYRGLDNLYDSEDYGDLGGWSYDHNDDDPPEDVEETSTHVSAVVTPVEANEPPTTTVKEDAPVKEEISNRVNPDNETWTESFLRRIHKYGWALKKHAQHIPPKRLDVMLGVLQDFFGKNKIEDEDIENACKVDPKGVYSIR